MYDFEDTSVPAIRSSREPKPNPFADIVAELSSMTDAWRSNPGDDARPAKAFSCPNAELRSVRRQLTDAGNAVEPPVTVRWWTTPNDDGESRVSIWVVPKQTRPGAGRRKATNE